MMPMLQSEWIKIKRSAIWPIMAISPAGVLLIGLIAGAGGASGTWMAALAFISVLHALLLLPLLTGVYAAIICRYEHAGGGWKLLFSLPISRTKIYAAKFILIALMVALTQLLLLGSLLIVGWINGFPSPVPWRDLAFSFAGGWIACLPLAALQLFASTALHSFAAPVAVNAVLTIPNVLIGNSTRFGPYYPWAQPMLAMIPRGEGGLPDLAIHIAPEVLIGSFVLFLLTGWIYMMKKPA